jgi:hypothetical protein
MACEKLEACALLDGLSGIPRAGSMVAATLCNDNKFSCGSYMPVKGVPQDCQRPGTKIELMEIIMEGLKQ